jgi:hypothetical protein
MAPLEYQFRRTRRQVLGGRLYLGCLAAAAVALLLGVPLLVRWLGGTRDPAWRALAALGASLVPALVGLACGALGGPGPGAVADERGVRRVPQIPRADACWPAIVDIRAERRAGRTVVAVYQRSGLILRLRAPYDGRLLGRDPQFEDKYFTLRNVWETHRRRRVG